MPFPWLDTTPETCAGAAASAPGVPPPSASGPPSGVGPASCEESEPPQPTTRNAISAAPTIFICLPPFARQAITSDAHDHRAPAPLVPRQRRGRAGGRVRRPLG